MTDREKIIETLKQTSDIWKKEEHHGYIVSVDLEKIADALIEAGFGDVKSLADGNCVLYVKGKGFMRLYNEQDIDKMIHRAEVAERALQKFAEYITCKDCPFFSDCASSEKMGYPIHSNHCFSEYLKQAVRDIEGERKND